MLMMIVEFEGLRGEIGNFGVGLTSWLVVVVVAGGGVGGID